MIQILKFPFRRNGFLHELVKREGRVCLVKRSKSAHWHYEVIQIQVEPDQMMFGRFIPAHERYPGSETWGTLGFTFPATDSERAFACLRELARQHLKLREGKDSSQGANAPGG
jgi:hypothetical protein